MYKPKQNSILTEQFTVITKLIVQLVNGHAVRLCCDIENDVGIISFVVHCSLVIIGRFTILLLAVGIEEAAETLDAHAAKDAENVTLMFIKLWGCFTAEDKKVVTEEGLYTRQAKVGETRAVV